MFKAAYDHMNTQLVHVGWALFLLVSLCPREMPAQDVALVSWGSPTAQTEAIPAPTSTLVTISAGYDFTLALQADGTVIAWGDDTYGQTEPPADLGTVRAISAGYGFALALRDDGTVAAWGDNAYGECVPTAGMGEVVDIAAGWGFSLALLADGTVAAWGDDSVGQTDVPTDLAMVNAIAAGPGSAMALQTDGTVVTWGNLPPAPAEAAAAVAIAAGADFGLALTDQGRVIAWGGNTSGVLDVPTDLSGVIAIAAGSDFALALDAQGKVTAWGDGSLGQLAVPGALTGVTKIAAGSQHAVAMMAIPSVPVDLVTGFVTRFYQQCLGRDPDAGGLQSWSDALSQGTLSGADVARGLALSQEFLNRNLTDSDFLDVLYQAFFNRAADPVGKAGWQDQLTAGVLREDVLYGFIQALEFKNLCATYNIMPINDLDTQQFQVRQFVRRFYQQCLGREPDAAGIANWTQGLLTGTLTGRDVARGFALSQEFSNKGTSVGVFLDILYKSFFDRAADDGGKAAWTSLLVSGSTRSTVLDGFVGAQEFVNLCNRYGILPFPPNG